MSATPDLVRTYQDQLLAGTREHAPRPGHGEFLMSRGDTDFLWSAAPAR